MDFAPRGTTGAKFATTATLPDVTMTPNDEPNINNANLHKYRDLTINPSGLPRSFAKVGLSSLTN